MKVEGSYTFERPREEVFPLLRDPEVLQKILPGCEQLAQVGEGQFKGTISVKVGPVQGKFDGEVSFSEIEEPERGALVVKGQGPSGFVSGSGRFWLENQDRGSLLAYEGDAQIGGRLASVGQRLLDTSAKAIIKSGLDGLAQQLTPPAAEPEPGGPAEKAEPPSHAAFARDVARNMAQEALGDNGARKLATWIVAGIGTAVGLYFVLRALRRRS